MGSRIFVVDVLLDQSITESLFTVYFKGFNHSSPQQAALTTGTESKHRYFRLKLNKNNITMKQAVSNQENSVKHWSVFRIQGFEATRISPYNCLADHPPSQHKFTARNRYPSPRIITCGRLNPFLEYKG